MLLEQHFGAGVGAYAYRCMLVLFGCLGLEGKKMLAGMVLVVGYLSGNGPEIGVYVEEIHIYADSLAVPFQVFPFEKLVDDDNLAVRGRTDKLVAPDGSAVRYTEKEKLPPLFEKGYCDVMPVDAAQLATQRAYIRANPRSRLLRMTNRQWLQPHRLTVDTAVSLPALYGYLQRECPRQLTADLFSSISSRLLQAGGHVLCDSYGNLELLRRPLLPVVCHRADAALFPNQKSRCLSAAASGSVLVSARISPSEKEILDTALLSGFPVVLLEANGFPDIFHPSADRMDDCAAGRLLLLTPWSYQFRNHDESVSVPFCKTMNCMVQAVCRQKDSWWKQS